MFRFISRLLNSFVAWIRKRTFDVLNRQKGTGGRELELYLAGRLRRPKTVRSGDIIDVRHYKFTARELEESRSHRRYPLPKVKRLGSSVHLQGAREG